MPGAEAGAAAAVGAAGAGVCAAEETATDNKARALVPSIKNFRSVFMVGLLQDFRFFVCKTKVIRKMRINAKNVRCLNLRE
jgi:hypothetical protein